MKKNLEFPKVRTTRRSFLRSSAAIAAATGLPSWFARGIEAQQTTPTVAKALTANDLPACALIGCGGRGRGIAKEASKFGKIVAVCDVDKKHAEAASADFGGAKIYHDFRDVLTRDDIHVVINGTPDHWHTLVNIGALKHGKDVYGEKPLTLTIDEGKHLVSVYKQGNRVFQTGSQQRSDPRFRLACELARNGRLGKLTEVITSLPAGPRGGPFHSAPVPPELDWDTWQGQTAAVDYVPERCHGNFRYWYHYSGGTMTDWGAHHNDIALWGMGLDRSGPQTIEGKQLIDMIPGGYTAASQYEVIYTYANGVRHTCRSSSDTPYGGPPPGARPAGELPHGVKFIGPEGWIFVTRGKIEASKPELLAEPLAGNAHRLYASDNHMGNFFDCVRSRKQPICEPEIGHRSVSVCHLGVISIRLKRKLNWDPQKEAFIDDAEAQSFVARPMRAPFDYQFVS
jgi:predicted dehydrogenase